MWVIKRLTAEVWRNRWLSSTRFSTIYLDSANEWDQNRSGCEHHVINR